MKKSFLFLILMVIVIFSQSCSGLPTKDKTGQKGNFSKLSRKELPTSPGFYFIDKKGLFELPPSSSNDVDFLDSPIIYDSNPEFIVFEKNINVDTLNLFDHTGNLYGVRFLPIEIQNDYQNYQMLQILTATTLGDGFYCFSSEIFINPYFGKNSDIEPWCFAVDTNKNLTLDAADDLTIPPSNQMGFFLLDHNEPEFITPSILKEEIDINNLPVTNKLFPTILFWSETVNPDYVQIYWRRPVIGVSFSIWEDNATVTEVESGLGADLAGVVPGDVIVGINGMEVSDWSIDQIRNKLSGDCLPEKTIELQILRGTQRYVTSVSCSLGDGSNLEDLTYILHPDGYAIFNVKYPLYSGNVYCMYIINSSEKHCFRIQ